MDVTKGEGQMRININGASISRKLDRIEQPRRLILRVLVAGLLLGFAGSAAVFASIPDINGRIHACYRTSNGSVRIIDDASENCTSSETAISWDQNNVSEPGGMVQNLAGANFTRSDLAYRDFSGADLHNAIFDLAILRGSDLHGANLQGASFQQTELELVDLHDTDLSGLTFSSVSFAGANLQGADFSTAQLSGVYFIGIADLSNANFTNAQLANSNFSGVDMSTVTITGATWSNVTCPDGSNSDSNGNTCAGHLTP